MFVYGRPEVLSPPTGPGLSAATYTDAEVAQALRESMAQGFSLLDSIAGAIRVYRVPVDQAYRAGDIVAAEINPGGFVIISEKAPVGYDYSAAQIFTERERDINNLYRKILNRDAETEGLQYWRDSGLSIPEIEAQIRQIARDIGVTAPQSYITSAVATEETTSVEYSDSQVAQALRESMAQGFSLLDSIAGAIRVFGVPVDQAYRAGDIVAAEIQAAQAAAAAKAAADAAAKAAADAAAKAAADRAAKAAADRAAKAAADAAAKAAADAAAKAAADAAAKAAADAAAKAALTVKPTGTRAFTDAEIAQAMRESLKQGFSLKDAVTGAVTKFAVPRDQAIRVAQQIASETQPITTAPAQANIGPLLLAVAAAYVLGA